MNKHFDILLKYKPIIVENETCWILLRSLNVYVGLKEHFKNSNDTKLNSYTQYH